MGTCAHQQQCTLPLPPPVSHPPSPPPRLPTFASHSPHPGHVVQVWNDHTWTNDDRVIGVSQSGRVALIEDCELRQEFWSTPAGPREGDGPEGATAPSHIKQCTPLHSVVTFASGFVVAGNNGCLMLFEKETGGLRADGKRWGRGECD